MARFIVCLPFSTETSNSKRPSMLAELGMIAIPPCLSSDNPVAGCVERRPQTNTATALVLENGSIPTYHVGQGNNIGENGDRQDRTSRLNDRVWSLEFSLTTGAGSRFTGADSPPISIWELRELRRKLQETDIRTSTTRVCLIERLRFPLIGFYESYSSPNQTSCLN